MQPYQVFRRVEVEIAARKVDCRNFIAVSRKDSPRTLVARQIEQFAENLLGEYRWHSERFDIFRCRNQGSSRSVGCQQMF